jgi:UDP-N-acetylmuramate dehydrogenase
VWGRDRARQGPRVGQSGGVDHMSVSFSDLTTLRVGGPPRHMITVETRDELVAAAREVWAGGDPWLLLGVGSNTVVGCHGFEGTLIRIATRGIEVLAREAGVASSSVSLPTPAVSSIVRSPAWPAHSVRLRVEAGEPWDSVVEFAVENGWAGIEALSGIPGSTGAAPVQNIGAYGQELASSLVAVTFLDAVTGNVTRLPVDDLGLGYRTSVFKRGLRGVVLSVDVELLDTGGVSEPVSYAALVTALSTQPGERVTLEELRRTVLALRASKGMVLDANDPDSVSVGSFFVNPIVRDTFARTLPADAPRWPRDDEATVKLSAAWLIEKAGIGRGFSLPGSRAAISNKHTLAIVNRGGASGEDVFELARFVRSRVHAEFGVLLEPEPVLVDVPNANESPFSHESLHEFL